MMLEGIWIRKIDRMRLIGIFCDVGKMKSEGFAQTPKFDLALVLEAKFEGLLCDLLTKQQVREKNIFRSDELPDI